MERLATHKHLVNSRVRKEDGKEELGLGEKLVLLVGDGDISCGRVVTGRVFR